MPRKHYADYIDTGNWGTTKTRNKRRVVYGFKHHIQVNNNAYCLIALYVHISSGEGRIGVTSSWPPPSVNFNFDIGRFCIT